ncbi:hypothetical protein HD806DRAFT_536557 [Xylariaceae sp. AK1471]|nr:hypothetical protein HD806DRAFT_536557 [Xylariaceae sp. AK1471]
MSNMDDVMDIQAHYNMSQESVPASVAHAASSFSMDEVGKVCPTCRGSLRSIARYGRIVRRAMLEATKKFITWSCAQFIQLTEHLLNTQQTLADTPKLRSLPRNTRLAKALLTTGRLRPLTLIKDWVGNDRYKICTRIQNQTNTFMGQARKEEEPLQWVDNLVRFASNKKKTQQEFVFDKTQVQAKAQLQALALSLKCEVIMISDFAGLKEELQGCSEIANTFSDDLKRLGAEHLRKSRTLSGSHSGATRGLSQEIDAA